MKLTLHGADHITGRIVCEALAQMEYDAIIAEEDSSPVSDLHMLCSLSSERQQRIDLKRPIRLGSIMDSLRKIERNIFLSYPEEIQIGHGLFQPHEMMFCVSGADPIPLTEKESSLILKLWSAKEQGHQASREMLLKEIWGYNADLETHTLETHIYRLRQKIEKDPAHPLILMTVEDGYKLVI